MVEAAAVTAWIQLSKDEISNTRLAGLFLLALLKGFVRPLGTEGLSSSEYSLGLGCHGSLVEPLARWNVWAHTSSVVRRECGLFCDAAKEKRHADG